MDYRHEYKHYLGYMDYLVIRQRLRSSAKADEHLHRSGNCLIRCLYFDGTAENEKFGIRCYNNNFNFVQLEKMIRINGVWKKESATITAAQVQAILNGGIEWMAASSEPLVTELYDRMKSELLKPKAIVDYIREQYIYIPDNVKITLDRSIRTGVAKSDFFNPALTTVSAGNACALLQVRYNENIPALIRDSIHLGNKREAAFSRHAACGFTV